jgi:murein DD-endopeptidase MepM/ murein hydrolase activator NlpD
VHNRRGVLRAVLGGGTLLLTGLLTVPILGAGGAAPPSAMVVGIPGAALRAYQAADDYCTGLRWELLAGIGSVESGHGTASGATADPDTGEVTPWIFGPRLDGSPGVRSLPIGRWLHWWGLTGPWQQAVGPMQFLPGTFAAWAIDADGDGVTNPHDLEDAVVTAANYLCQGVDGEIADERAALLRYNRSDAYVAEVLAYADALEFASIPIDGVVCPVAGPVSFIDTWGAPRSGGRQHEGVDMFALYGTPVVAPVAGRAEQSNNSLGGLSFRLWGDDGNFYYGAHLSSYASTFGHVEAGTILGYVGTSGNARGTSPHLHFEIRPGRRPGDPSSPVNPTPTVAASCATWRLGVGLSGGD